jgi:hypothetical protein
VRHRRDAEKPRDDHGGHRDEDRPHNRLTLVQADLHSEPNRRTPRGQVLARSACSADSRPRCAATRSRWANSTTGTVRADANAPCCQSPHIHELPRKLLGGTTFTDKSLFRLDKRAACYPTDWRRNAQHLAQQQ